MKITVNDLLQEPTVALMLEEAKRRLEEEAVLRLQFYDSINEQQKAEFINGEIVLHSPATADHNAVLKRIMIMMEMFVQRFSLGLVGFEKLMIHLTRNSYEPDICFFTQEQASKFSKDEKLFPAPTLIVEILSKSTEKTDRNTKFEDYQAHGVTEYWIVDGFKEVVEQYVLKRGKYELHHKGSKGNITSVAIPGFIAKIACFFDEEHYFEFLDADKKAISSLKKQTNELENILSEKENKLTETLNQLTEKENQLTEKENLINEKENLITEKDIQLTEKENIISEQSKLLAEKDRIIEELKKKS